MIPATEPRAIRDSGRLLVVESALHTFHDARVSELPEMFAPGDLLILNDAGTLPASLPAATAIGDPVEIRLLQHTHGSEWSAVIFGNGDWQIPTESRTPPPKVSIGDRLQISNDFDAEIVRISERSDRLITLRFNRDMAGMWHEIYAYGRPIQYSYLKNDLPLWSVQTAYAARPWAMEMPSAGYPLTWSILFELRRRGIGLAWLTHAAGLSSVGPTELDRLLPMTESFEIPRRTAEAIAKTRFEGGRIIAVGTTVVRALEGCAVALDGRIMAGRGETNLIIDEAFRPSIVKGLLTGMHDPGQSHYRLLLAFSNESTLREAWIHAVSEGYRCHEFGDSCLIL
jgi:S-adenosylmethionine:tRNA ribosyltransferase-isomerase